MLRSLPRTFLGLAPLLTAAAAAPWQDLYRVPIPEELPPHPRVFCSAADLTRVRGQIAAGDAYAVACRDAVLASAEAALREKIAAIEGQPSPAVLARAAALAQGYALTADERFARQTRAILLAVADAAMRLERTGQAGLLAPNTLAEGPVAVNFAMAYDLVADSAALTAADREGIRGALRRVAWEAGHRCHHPNSSNWRSWALCVLASCGFAAGDRRLIEEAINGAWDPERECYLYGVVQQLTHSVFSDGIHWERCMGYTYYTGSALMYVLVAAANSGVDLWHADLPGITGPFQGGAPHEEYGPPGPRSIKAFLDAPFYYAFPGGGFARIGDSPTRALAYHPLYELAWREYRDPKYAWLIRRERDRRGQDSPSGWHIWTPSGTPSWSLVPEMGANGSAALRFETPPDARIAAVQDVVCPGNRVLRVSGRVKALAMAGGRAHIRCNAGQDAFFTESVTAAGDWREVSVEVPPGTGPAPRSVRLHVFLEGGAGEVLWDAIRATAGEGVPDLVRNGSFAAGRADGRPDSFWHLVHGAARVPEGRYDLAEDADIGLSGRHRNGCTLFPVGGFVILRSDPGDPEALAVNLAFGPYGSGHDHPDRLTLTVHALGQTLCPDAGSWGYENPMHLTWANQTVAHNTVCLDERAQEPQGLSKSIWAGERGDQRVFGVLRLFHPGGHLKAVRATCDTAYPDTSLDRTVCLVGDCLVDVFRVAAAGDHTIDLPLHARGEVTADGSLTPLAESPFSGLGYAHLQGIRRREAQTGIVRATFTDGDRRLYLLQSVPPDAEIFLARDPERRGDENSCLLARRHGRQATFVTVLAPSRGECPVRHLRVTSDAGAVAVEIHHAGVIDRLALPDAVDGALRFERRTGQDARLLAREEARPEPPRQP
ncbi:MAG: heparinase II/III family protein [Lentisphaeria bacterium]|nr:heparinase II/III family protein [Lentisphaeria bacterium]